MKYYIFQGHAPWKIYLGVPRVWTSRRRAQTLRERTALTKTGKMQSIFPERVSANGVPENPWIFGESYSYKSENPLDKASLISSSSIEESESCRGTAADLL